MKKVISDNWNCIVYDTESNTFEKFVKSTNSFEMDSVTIAEYDG